MNAFVRCITMRDRWQICKEGLDVRRIKKKKTIRMGDVNAMAMMTLYIYSLWQKIWEYHEKVLKICTYFETRKHLTHKILDHLISSFLLFYF